MAKSRKSPPPALTGLLATALFALASLFLFREARAPAARDSDLVSLEGRVAYWNLVEGKSTNNLDLGLEGQPLVFRIPHYSLKYPEMNALMGAEPPGSVVVVSVPRQDLSQRPGCRAQVYLLRSARREYVDMNRSLSGIVQKRLNLSIGGTVFALLTLGFAVFTVAMLRYGRPSS